MNFLRKYFLRKKFRKHYPESKISLDAKLDHLSVISHKIILGKNTKIGYGVNLSGNVEIGDYSYVNDGNSIIDAEMNSVKIGKHTSIASNIFIRTTNHIYSRVTTNPYLYVEFFKEIDYCETKGNVTIGNDVWIGANVTILSGVNIGSGSVIGAGSVVTKSIPNYAIAFGNPAKVYKYRFSSNVIEFLNELEWWNWDAEKVKINSVFFSLDLTKVEVNEIREIIK